MVEALRSKGDRDSLSQRAGHLCRRRNGGTVSGCDCDFPATTLMCPEPRARHCGAREQLGAEWYQIFLHSEFLDLLTIKPLGIRHSRAVALLKAPTRKHAADLAGNTSKRGRQEIVSLSSRPAHPTSQAT